MIVRSLGEVVGTERDVDGGSWRSRRLLLERDGLPFSLHDTVVAADATIEMQYANHVEAVYVTGGEGSLRDAETGAVYRLEAGVLYVLDGHERHVVSAETELRMVCVFVPPVIGAEVHDETGGFPASGGLT